MQQLLRINLPARRETPPAPWGSRRVLWGGFLATVALYMVGSLVGAALLQALGRENSPWLGAVLLPVQLGMALLPLAIIRRYGSPRHLLGLDHIDGWMVLEVGAALMVAYCGIFAWGLVLLPFDIQAQEPIAPLFGRGLASTFSVIFAATVAAPIAEEVLFRGFLFGGLRAQTTVRRGAALSAALFAAIHLQPFAFPALFLLGLLLATVYHRSGSLWAPILMHMAVNWIGVLGQLFLQSRGLI